MLLVWDCKNVTGKLGHLVPYIDGVSGPIMTLLSWPAQIRIWECGLLLVFNRCCKEWLERSETWRLPSMSSRVVMNLILMSPTMIVRFNLSLKQMRIFSQHNQLHRSRGNVITAMPWSSWGMENISMGHPICSLCAELLNSRRRPIDRKCHVCSKPIQSVIPFSPGFMEQ